MQNRFVAAGACDDNPFGQGSPSCAWCRAAVARLRAGGAPKPPRPFGAPNAGDGDETVDDYAAEGRQAPGKIKGAQ